MKELILGLTSGNIADKLKKQNKEGSVVSVLTYAASGVYGLIKLFQTICEGVLCGYGYVPAFLLYGRIGKPELQFRQIWESGGVFLSQT